MDQNTQKSEGKPNGKHKYAFRTTTINARAQSVMVSQLMANELQTETKDDILDQQNNRQSIQQPNFRESFLHQQQKALTVFKRNRTIFTTNSQTNKEDEGNGDGEDEGAGGHYNDGAANKMFEFVAINANESSDDLNSYDEDMSDFDVNASNVNDKSTDNNGSRGNAAILTLSVIGGAKNLVLNSGKALHSDVQIMEKQTRSVSICSSFVNNFVF